MQCAVQRNQIRDTVAQTSDNIAEIFQYFYCFNCAGPFSICFISLICLDLFLINFSYYSSCVNSESITQCSCHVYDIKHLK